MELGILRNESQVLSIARLNTGSVHERGPLWGIPAKKMQGGDRAKKYSGKSTSVGGFSG